MADGIGSPKIPPKGSLFVGDISFFCSESDLARLFDGYGRILHAEVKRGKFGESLMHAFVELASVDGAQQAIRALHGTKFMGRRIRVFWAFANAEKSQPRNREGWTQVYVSFSSARLDLLVTEELLDNLFGRYGDIADVTVKKHVRAVDPPQQSGYAFVYFYDATAAMIAADKFKAIVIHDISLECSLSFRSQKNLETSPSLTPRDFIPPPPPHSPQQQSPHQQYYAGKHMATGSMNSLRITGRIPSFGSIQAGSSSLSAVSTPTHNNPYPSPAPAISVSTSGSASTLQSRQSSFYSQSSTPRYPQSMGGGSVGGSYDAMSPRYHDIPPASLPRGPYYPNRLDPTTATSPRVNVMMYRARQGGMDPARPNMVPQSPAEEFAVRAPASYSMPDQTRPPLHSSSSFRSSMEGFPVQMNPRAAALQVQRQEGDSFEGLSLTGLSLADSDPLIMPAWSPVPAKETVSYPDPRLFGDGAGSGAMRTEAPKRLEVSVGGAMTSPSMIGRDDLITSPYLLYRDLQPTGVAAAKDDLGPLSPGLSAAANRNFAAQSFEFDPAHVQVQLPTDPMYPSPHSLTHDDFLPTSSVTFPAAPSSDPRTQLPPQQTDLFSFLAQQTKAAAHPAGEVPVAAQTGHDFPGFGASMHGYQVFAPEEPDASAMYYQSATQPETADQARPRVDSQASSAPSANPYRPGFL